MRSFKAGLSAAAFIVAAAASLAPNAVRADSDAPRAPVVSALLRPTAVQASSRLAVQISTPVPTDSSRVPLQTDAPAPKAEEVETQETKAEETKPQQTQAPDTKVQETKATTLEPQDAKAQQTKPQEVKAQGIDAQEAKAQDNTPAPARGGAETGTQASVPPPAQAAPHASEAAPAGATKQDAAAPHQDAKQDGGSGAGKDAKQDAKQDGNAQSPAPAPSGAPANAQTSTPSSAQTGTQASAGACPGNPNALGTSRVLAIDPADFKRIGRMQYPDSLPLQDKEVVITFDDGPLPPYSTQILDILKSECVKVTYFLVGEMARAYPALVRREYEEGHTIGTHSEDHPLHFGELSLDRMRAEIDRGISDVGAALGDTKYLAPFFRLPGLDRSNLVEEQLAARNLIVFSSDTVADDWRHVSPEQIKTLALKRLEERGKGILLLHDIHAKTAAALPGLLKALKDNGFRIVQVVPSASYEMAMLKKPLITKPMARILASAVPAELKLGAGLDNAAARPAWPQPAAENLTADIAALPAPDASAFQPDSVADDSASVQWPEQPKASAAADDDKPRSGKTAERTRHKKHDSDSAEHEGRHHRDHDRKRAGNDRHRADLVTEIKSLAALLIPAH